MIAICHRCGAPKAAPIERCSTCGSAPVNEEELVLSFALTDRLLSKSELTRASRLIKNGQRVEVPPEIRLAVLSAIAKARAEGTPTRGKQVSSRATWGILLGLAAILLLIFNPWPHYQWASLLDTIPAYEGFVNRFPSSDYTYSARQRIHVLREPEVWAQADASDRIEALRAYVRDYPGGQHANEAKERITKIADAQWEHVSSSRSEAEIREFLSRYPETTKVGAAEARIQQLYDDLDWVREQDSLDHYRRFATRFPDHPEIEWIKKRIIDLEVREIAAGEYAEMPRAEPLSLGGSSAYMEVENQTGYELTVRFSGPDSEKLIIPIGATRSITLPPGTYAVAASVTAANVRNYYGADTLRGGRYTYKFYIESR